MGGLLIPVIASPRFPGPTAAFSSLLACAEVTVNMEDRVEVLRGQMAQITCNFVSAEGIGGMTIEWFYVTRQGEKKKIYSQDSSMRSVESRTQFTDRISVNGTGATGIVVLTINNVQVEDEVEFICLVKSLTEGTGEGRTNLKVFEIPNFPTIEGVQTGISVLQDSPSKIGTCEVKNGYPKPQITWYKNRKPLLPIQDEVIISPSITMESSGLFSVRSELRMKVVKENKDDEFYCEVNYPAPGGETRMTETERINITVYYPSTAVKMWVESPKGKIKEGDSVELHCQDNGNPPSSLIAIRHIQSDTNWDEDMVMLHKVRRQDGGLYECISTDTDSFKEVSGNMTLSINYLEPAVVEPKGVAFVVQGEELKAMCNALSSLSTHTAWLKDGLQISTGHILILKDATFDTAGTYDCVVSANEIQDMQTNGTLVVQVLGPPQIIDKNNVELEKRVDETVDLSCSARAFPTPSFIWTTSDGRNLETKSEEIDGVFRSSVQFPVNSDVTVFCNVSNEYGVAAVTFNIKTPKQTTTPATTTTTTTTIHSTTEGNGVVIAVIIVCILLLAILGSVLYFLYKKGKICGRSGKQDLTKETNKDNIVVEMKSDNTEEAVLLGVNGEKQPLSD
ncbi:MUC18 Cell surface glycoprotein P1H12 [Takifugu flavidus]|uniref:MUC18 Cell surface glycoprotein P1H12 n=1 Tax=Takifugu flavidus TaxID=433684 RepID=A0A5C6PCW1_9TELE|nr:MUC18 Cell surface glycoprotein P1H12 [Takifugu flavidus]